MGLRTFWSQLSAPKIEEIPLKQTRPISTYNKTQKVVIRERNIDVPTQTSDILPLSKTTRTSRKRKSWFGGQPTPNDSIPQVPVLDRKYVQVPEAAHLSTNYSAPDVSPATVIEQSKRKSRRISLSRKSFRQSTHNNYQTLEALPPVPTLPASMQASTEFPQPAGSRKSRALTLNRKNSDDAASRTKQRKRLSLWESSNPDNSEDDSIPPVPALIQDRSTTPESRHSKEHRRKDSGQDNSTQSVASRRTYTPRNAAAGFLMSTSGATEATRKSFRKSFHIADHNELVCLTAEQQSEWEKLRSMRKNFAQELDRSDDSSEPVGRSKYSNKQALAALESGTR